MDTDFIWDEPSSYLLVVLPAVLQPVENPGFFSKARSAIRVTAPGAVGGNLRFLMRSIVLRASGKDCLGLSHGFEFTLEESYILFYISTIFMLLNAEPIEILLFLTPAFCRLISLSTFASDIILLA